MTIKVVPFSLVTYSFMALFFFYWINTAYKHQKMQKSGEDIKPQVSEHKQPLNQCKKELFSQASHFISTHILPFIGKHLVPRRA